MAKGVVLEGVKDSYKILISYNCQVDIEEHLGVENIHVTLSENINAKIVRVIMKYGLEYGENRKATLKEVGEIIDDILEKYDFLHLRSKVIDAVNFGLGADENAESVEEPEGK